MSLSRIVVERTEAMLPLANSVIRVVQTWEEGPNGERFYCATDGVNRVESTYSMRQALLELALKHDAPPLPDDPGPMPLPSPRKALERAMERGDGAGGVLAALGPSAAVVTVSSLAQALQALDHDDGQLSYEQLAEELIRYVRAH